MSDPREEAPEQRDSAYALFRRTLAESAAERMRPLESRPQQKTTLRSTTEADSNEKGERPRLLAIKAGLQERLFEELEQREQLSISDEEISDAVREFVNDVLATEDLAINQAEREHLAAELVEEALGLGPLAPLMSDPAITDILVNGPEQVYVERFGRLEQTRIRFRDEEHIERIITRLAMRIGRRIDRSWPMVDLRLPDGSRVNATLPPASIDGPTISIRRFGRRRLQRSDLLRLGMLSEPMAEFLRLAVSGRANILISGGTGAGKSTLLGAIAESIPPDERIITIEDTAELVLDQEHVVRLETRPPNVEGRGQITARDLLVNCLRMRPTRIIVGEVRGAEALDMLQAMNTGHEGGLCTLHANSPRDALSRLETMVLLAGTELPSRAIREQITSALHLVVHVRRYEDGVRRIDRIAEITGLEQETPLAQELFRFDRTGGNSRRVEGRFVATGIVPRIADQLRNHGFEPDPELFRGSRSLS